MNVGPVNELTSDGSTRKPSCFKDGQVVGTFNPLLLVSGVFGFSFAGWINVGRDFHLGIGIVFEVALGRSEGSVNGSVADPKVKRFAFFLTVPAPYVFIGPLGVVVG